MMVALFLDAERPGGGHVPIDLQAELVAGVMVSRGRAS
jgi:hypothetical protein